jgi:hypothetical protein
LISGFGCATAIWGALSVQVRAIAARSFSPNETGMIGTKVISQCGLDANYDQQNYHFYAPYALFNNRILYDIFPAFSGPTFTNTSPPAVAR